jgi:putative hydrolase of the HAD superfamily
MELASVDFLAHRPELISELAVAFKEQWAPTHPPEHVEKIKEHFRQCLHTDRLPLALIAHLDGQLAGVVALLEHSVRSRSDLGPWLGALYVFPRYRCHGIGTMLIRRAEHSARELGINALFAGTETAVKLFDRARTRDA